MNLNFEEHVGHYITALHEGEILVGRLLRVSYAGPNVWINMDHFPQRIAASEITECSCGKKFREKKEEGSKAP